MAVNYIVQDALKLCGNILIPSIFPFMVLTNLLISCGFEGMVKCLIKRPFEYIFHLNANLASAYFIGLIAGYPQGAYAVCSIYDKGGCTKEEAQRAIAFCNNTGPAFVIAGIGGMYRNIRIGVMLYLLQISVSLLYGIITRPKKVSICPEKTEKKEIGFDVIPRAVTSSVLPMLEICGFVIIFSLICNLISRIPVPIYLKGVIYTLTEISCGSNFVCNNALPLALCGFGIMWSGLCVHLQTHAVVKKRFSMKRYYIGKALQAISVFLLLYLKNTVL